IFIFIFSCLNTSAQEIDSLQNLAAKEKSVTKKARLLFEITDHWSYTDSSKAIEFLNEAKALANKNEFLQALAVYYEAGIYFDHDIERSQMLYMQSIRLLGPFDTREANEYKARSWHNYAVLDQLKGKDKSFLDITLKYCIPYAQQSGNKELLSAYLSDVGMIFYNHKAYDKSIDYYQQAIDVLSTEENKIGRASCRERE